MSNSKKNKYLSLYLLFQKCLILTVFINNVHCQKFIEVDPHLTFGSHFNKLGEASSTEKITDWFSHNLKEKVQTIKQSAYSVSKVNEEDKKDKLSSLYIDLYGGYKNSIFNFNSKGNLVDIITIYEEDIYYPTTFDYQDGIREYHERVSDGYIKGVYKWDEEKGLPISFEGGVLGNIKFDYGKDKVKMTFFKEKEVLNIEQTYNITYDENDNSITTEILYGDGSLIQRHKVFYNSKGQKYKRIFYNQYHTSYETFTYNSSGDIEKMVKYEGKDNKLQFECNIVYKYDKNKNWIFRKETDSSSDTEKIIERTITYYK